MSPRRTNQANPENTKLEDTLYKGEMKRCGGVRSNPKLFILSSGRRCIVSVEKKKKRKVIMSSKRILRKLIILSGKISTG